MYGISLPIYGHSLLLHFLAYLWPFLPLAFPCLCQQTLTPLQLDAIVSPPCAGVMRYFAPSPFTKPASNGGGRALNGGDRAQGGGGRALSSGGKKSLNGGSKKSHNSVGGVGVGGPGGSEGLPAEEEWVLVLTVQLNQQGHSLSSTTALSQESGGGGGGGGSGGARGGGTGGSLGGLLLLAACDEATPHNLKATFTPDTQVPSGAQAQGLGLGLAQGLGLGLVGDPPETVLAKYVPLVVHPAATMILWPAPLPPLPLGQSLSQRIHLNARLVLRNRGDMGTTPSQYYHPSPSQ